MDVPTPVKSVLTSPLTFGRRSLSALAWTGRQLDSVFITSVSVKNAEDAVNEASRRRDVRASLSRGAARHPQGPTANGPADDLLAGH
jgi:hypothetical protein